MCLIAFYHKTNNKSLIWTRINNNIFSVINNALISSFNSTMTKYYHGSSKQLRTRLTWCVFDVPIGSCSLWRNANAATIHQTKPCRDKASYNVR